MASDRGDHFAEAVVGMALLVDLVIVGLTAADVDQPSAWGRDVLFAAIALCAEAIVAASAAVVLTREARPAMGPSPISPYWSPRLALLGATSVAVAVSLAAAAFTSDSAKRTAAPPSQSNDGQQAQGTTPASQESDDELAREFRPVLFFDSKEPWRPLNVENFLAEQYPDGRRQRVCPPTRINCTQLSGLTSFVDVMKSSPTLGQGMFLDLVGSGGYKGYKSPASSRCRHLAVAQECDDDRASAIYYNVTPHAGLVFIDYWWFLRFNHVDRLEFAQKWLKRLCVKKKLRAVCFDHEGDWEGVTVVVMPTPAPRVVGVSFAAHEWTLFYRAAQIRLLDGRPAVYVARGSHAAYPEPCSGRRCKQPIRRFTRKFPEGQHDGSVPWFRNTDAACLTSHPCVLRFPPLGSSSAPSWTDWAGRWGRVCADNDPSCVVGDGPRSPGLQARFKSPWCSYRGGKCIPVVTVLATAGR